MTAKESFRARLRRLFPTAAHLALFLRVASWLAALPILIRILALPRLLSLLDPGKRPVPAAPTPASDLELVSRYLTGLLNLNPQNRAHGACLKRSLLLFRFARLAGLPAVFFVGVKKENGALAGHAWIEIAGERRFDPRADIVYSVTFSFPSTPGGK